MIRLCKVSDDAFRVLLYAANVEDERLVTVEETAALYGMSRAQVKVVVRLLIRAGYLQGVRGRTSGFRLALAPEQINLGAVLRATASDFGRSQHLLQGNASRLPRLIDEALAALVAVFDRHTLADILAGPRHGTTEPPPPVPQPGPLVPPPSAIGA